MTPEQIIGKMAERIAMKFSNSDPAGSIAAELQPLADLIRAAQGVVNNKSSLRNLRILSEALERLGSI